MQLQWYSNAMTLAALASKAHDAADAAVAITIREGHKVRVGAAQCAFLTSKAVVCAERIPDEL